MPIHASCAVATALIAVAAVLVPTRSVAGPALVFEVNTSRILFADAPDTPWYPASLTKLMTAYVVFDALRRDEVSATAEIVVSPHANAQPPTRVGLGANTWLTVKEALAGLIIQSANDLAVALAEAVSGDEADFVAEMNETAAKLGMLQTRFANASGLPAEGQATTARDMAILTRALLRDFPQWRYLYSEPSATVGRRTVSTHNDVLVTVAGADGMKTGFTCGAGYNIVASATRDGRQIAAVVLGETSNRARTLRAEQLLTNAFAVVTPADAPPLEADPVTGEALVDVPNHQPARRAADHTAIRNCPSPVPTVQPVLIAGLPTTEGQATTAQTPLVAAPRSQAAPDDDRAVKRSAGRKAVAAKRKPTRPRVAPKPKEEVADLTPN